MQKRIRANALSVGKQWHEPKTAFRPKAGNGTYEKRQAERVAMAAVKAKEKEMKDEKEAARKVRYPYTSSNLLLGVIDGSEHVRGTTKLI